MNKFISNIKVICLSAVLAATSLSGNVADAQGTSTGRKHYIVFHDDYQNIITRVEPSSTNYTFHADDPFFFVTLPISNTGWSTDLLTPEQWSAGTSTPEMTFYDGEKISKYSISLPLTEDLHLYPVTQYGTYIRFDSRGGTPVPFQFVHVGESITQPSGITKQGYVFGGWYNTPACQSGDEFNFNWTPAAPGESIPREKYAFAKWTPASGVNYEIHVWLEKAEHPLRTSLADAKAHQFEDYVYGTSIRKSGTTGGDVSFTSDDMSDSAVKAVTMLEVPYSNSFPIYFYDDDNDSYAQSLSEASVNDINHPSLLGAFKGIKPDGTTVVNVFYRKMVFDVTVGILNSDYTGSGNPSWDSRYDHPTVTMRDGEKIGSAIERAIQNGTSVSAATISLFQTNTDAMDSDYHGFWKFTGFSGFTTGLATNFTNGGVWNQVVNSLDIYNSQAAVLTGTRSSWQSVNDGFTFYTLMPTYTKTGNEFRRYFYVQTIDAAVNNRTDVTGLGGAIQNPGSNYELLETYRTWKGKTSDGFHVSSIDGFNFNVTQCVKRRDNGEGSLEAVDFANGDLGGNYKDFGSSGYQLEIFFKRASYTLDLVSAPGPDADVRSYTIYYHDNLSSVSPKTGGKDFIPGTTYYTDSEGKKFVFMGWYDNAVYNGSPVDFSEFSMPSHNVSLYAKWEVHDIVVKFDAKQGTVGTPASQVKEYTIITGTIPADPGDAEPLNQSGHVAFFCWLKDGVMYDFAECLYEDTTLEALYYVDPADPFTITYKSGKGTGTDVVEFADYGYLYNANAGYKPYNYSDYFATWGLPKGKVFKYWSGSNGEIYDSYEDPDKEIIMTEDVVLTAIYEGGNADIVINREDLNPGESATYTVSSLGEGGMKTYLLSVVLTNTKGVGDIASRKIVDLEPGNYIVEETSWNWAYDKSTPVIDKETKKIDANTGWGSGSVNYDETLEFTFSGDGLSEVSKHGEGYRYNEFKGTPSGDVPEGGSETPGSGGTDL